MEVFRGPNSALYGSDALASVINITTRRGVTPLPELSYSAEGGSYGTLHQESNLGGVWNRFDYFTDVSRFDTQNSTPNSEFHNGSCSRQPGMARASRHGAARHGAALGLRSQRAQRHRSVRHPG